MGCCCCYYLFVLVFLPNILNLTPVESVSYMENLFPRITKRLFICIYLLLLMASVFNFIFAIFIIILLIILIFIKPIGKFQK